MCIVDTTKLCKGASVVANLFDMSDAMGEYVMALNEKLQNHSLSSRFYHHVLAVLGMLTLDIFYHKQKWNKSPVY